MTRREKRERKEKREKKKKERVERRKARDSNRRSLVCEGMIDFDNSLSNPEKVPTKKDFVLSI
jgi:hypothetical protein